MKIYLDEPGNQDHIRVLFALQRKFCVFYFVAASMGINGYRFAPSRRFRAAVRKSGIPCNILRT